MDGFQLTPEAINYLPIALFLVVISGYLLSIRRKSRTSWLLTGAILALTAVFTGAFLSFSVAEPWQPFWNAAFSSAAVVHYFLLVWFAYVFLENPFPREARVVVWGSGLAAFGLIGYEAYQLFTTPHGFFLVNSFLGLYLMIAVLWALVVFVRKARRAGGTAARAHRAFALYVVIMIAGTLMASLQDAGIFSREVHQVLFHITVLAAIAWLVEAYVRYGPEASTLQVKLVGLSLASMLVALGIVGLSFYEHEALVRDSGNRIAAGEALRFTPAGGGYRMAPAPHALDPEPGERLDLAGADHAAVPFGFAFPFYGERWAEGLVHAKGIVSFGGPVLVPAENELRAYPLYYLDFYSERPKVAPLFHDLDPAFGGAVYVKRAPDRVTLTWHEVPRFNTAAPNTFQLVLHADGIIDFIYGEVGTMLEYGKRGLHPGGTTPPVVAARLGAGTPLEAGPGAALVEDFSAYYRAHAHAVVRKLFYLMVGMTAFILVFFPLFFRSSIFQPLGRLLEGVRRLNEGDLAAQVPVQASDEIGTLTRDFNRMGQSLQAAHEALRAYAGTLEQRVAERTAEVEAQKARLLDLDAQKSRFFANISHEFRTPLTLILAPLRDALDSEPAETTTMRREQVAVMHRNGQRLLRLINQILDIARIEAGQMHLDLRHADLAAALRAIALAFVPLAERKRIDYRIDVPETPVVTAYDTEAVEKIGSNLLSNAFKFTPEDGSVRISLEPAEQGGDGVPEGEAMLRITVRDSGPGIPRDELPHIFERFYRVDESSRPLQPGTGIGLSLVKELVELHAGHIQVESEPGFGTTFTVCLPHTTRALPETPAALLPALPGEALTGAIEAFEAFADPAPAAPQNEAEQDRPTVLVVDDNADIRAFVRAHLAPHYRVAEAADGRAALDDARRLLPDLILADVMMPELDGYGLLQALRRDPALDFIPVVLLTAKAERKDRLEGLERGADDYLTKPFDVDELKTRVDNLIRQRRHLHTRFARLHALRAGAVDAVSSDDAFLEQVRRVVEEHLGDDSFSVDQLAEAVGYSRVHLYRKLRDLVGQSPSEVIRTMRLERASQLLAARAGTVSEIAYGVGFQSVSYFSRCFQEQYEVPPSSYAASRTA